MKHGGVFFKYSRIGLVGNKRKVFLVIESELFDCNRLGLDLTALSSILYKERQAMPLVQSIQSYNTQKASLDVRLLLDLEGPNQYKSLSSM